MFRFLIILYTSTESLEGFAQSESDSPPAPLRVLPGAAKGGYTPSYTTSTNCQGYWSAYSSCSSSGTQSRSYTITTAKTGSGTDCPAYNGQTQSQSCTPPTQAPPPPTTTTAAPVPAVNCQGSWSSYSTCSSFGTQSRTYTVTTPASGGGAQCPAYNGQYETRTCPVSCAGVWSAWSGTCNAQGKEQRTYTVTRTARNGGANCPASNGQIEMRDLAAGCTTTSTGAPGGSNSYGGNANPTTTSSTESNSPSTPTPGPTTVTPTVVVTVPPAQPAGVVLAVKPVLAMTLSSSVVNSPTEIAALKDNRDFVKAMCKGIVASANAVTGATVTLTETDCAVRKVAVATARRLSDVQDVSDSFSEKPKTNFNLRGSGSTKRRKLQVPTSSVNLQVEFDLFVSTSSAASSLASQVTHSSAISSLSSNVNSEISNLPSLSSTLSPSVSSTVASSMAAVTQAQVLDLSWSSDKGGQKDQMFFEMRLQTCDKGQRLRFSWTHSTDNNLYQLPDEASYVKCDFSNAVGPLGPTSAASLGSAVSWGLDCDTKGMLFFATRDDSSQQSPGSRSCTDLRKKLRVHMTDLSLTSTLRGTLNPETGLNHFSLTTVYTGFLIQADYMGTGFSSNGVADQAATGLWCVAPHGAHGCEDWLPSQYLTENNGSTCEALVETDLGYVFRKRPNPDYGRALEYYQKALNLVPNFCPAMAYKAGLEVQRGDYSSPTDRERAFAAFRGACAACGGDETGANMEIEGLKDEYRAREWSVPCNTACSQRLTFGESCYGSSGTGKDGETSSSESDAATAAIGVGGVVIFLLVGAAARTMGKGSSSNDGETKMGGIGSSNEKSGRSRGANVNNNPDNKVESYAEQGGLDGSKYSKVTSSRELSSGPLPDEPKRKKKDRRRSRELEAAVGPPGAPPLPTLDGGGKKEKKSKKERESDAYRGSSASRGGYEDSSEQLRREKKKSKKKDSRE